MRCPFHDDRTPSFYVNKENGAWICHAGSCGLHGSFDKLYKLLQNTVSVPVDYISAFREKAKAVDIGLKFLIDRGFTADMLDRWEIAYNEEVGAVEIPCRRPDGHFVGYILRMPEGEKPKYRHPAGFPRTNILFGIDKLLPLGERKEVCLVEGPLDAIWLQEAGAPGVAILGTALAEEQVTILYELNVRHVCLCFDNDEAGAQATAAAAKAIPHNGMWLRSIRLPPDYKDIQEVPFGDVPKVFSGRHIHVNGGDLIPPELDRWR